MKIIQSALLVAMMATLSPLGAQNLTVVPYPQSVMVNRAAPFPLKDGYTISAAKEFAAAADLFIEDAQELYSIKGNLATDKATITLVKKDGLADEAYELEVTQEGICIKASQYNAAVMGVTTLLQMIDCKTLTVPSCAIKDAPEHAYRTYMLDVARQWNELETIRHHVDLCRWYKLRYMQIHLSDDQKYTFESKIYPQLTEGRKDFYSQEQLRELVDYAAKRGVILIPEFDLPGHSTAMRRLMPDVFGATNLSMIDVLKPECIKAVQDIAKEMMDVFHTSPYFHIGADEVWLGKYQTLEHVQEYVKNNPDKVGNVHDLYLRFIVEMHEFVKSCGKKTIIWESFGGTGSKHIKIPNDMFVLAWETLYQRPESLIANGFQIANATWKPCYICPGFRWSPEYIYNWNPRRWENHWNAAPSYHNPIQLKDNTQLHGVQMCAWEMADYEQLLSSHDRVPALSENGWNDQRKQAYEDYAPRAAVADAKIMTLIFPAKETREGFKEADPTNVSQNRGNSFTTTASVFFEPLHEGDSIYYTTDRKFPTPESKKMTETLTLTNDVIVQYGMYDAQGKLKAYKTIPYSLRPIEFEYSGEVPLRDIKNFDLLNRQTFNDSMTITLTNNMPGSIMRYSIDKKPLTKDSPEYTAPVVITDTNVLTAAVYDKDGKCLCKPYRIEVTKVPAKK